MIQVDELNFSGGTIFCAFSTNETYPANGGLRVMQYPDNNAAKSEAVGLASKMIYKHRNYHTGFSGGKIVAAVKNIEPDTMSSLIDEVGGYLNAQNGRFLTGCDLNFGDKEVTQLYSKSKHVLAALNSDVHYAEATAAGVIGAVKASVELKDIEAPKALVHGCGAVGSRSAKQLASKMNVMTFDLLEDRANINGCTNISSNQNWMDLDCDILIMVSASRILTLEDVQRFRGKAIVCGANIPFANEAAEAYAKEHFLLIDEGVASAGAVIADSIEYYAKDKWTTTAPQAIYNFIESQVFDLSMGRRNKALASKKQFIGELV